MHRRRQFPLSYVVALGSIGAAVLIRWLLNPLLGNQLPYITLFAAIALTVWFGGWRPAVFAVVLGYVATLKLFIETEPNRSLTPDQPGGLVALVVYVFTTSIIIVLGEGARAALSRAEASRGDALAQHERLKQEMARRKDLEELFRQLVEEVRDYAILMLDPEGRVVSWNTGAERILGYRAEEILGQHWSRFYPERAQRAGLPMRALEVVRTRGPWESEGWRIRSDGSRFWANVVVTALRDRAGALVGFSTVTRDLTERRRVTETLRSIVDHVLDGIITIDEHGTIQSFNHAAERLFGYQAGEVIGRNVNLLMPEPYHGEHDRYLGNYLRTGEPKIIGKGREVVGRRKDGSTFPVALAVNTFEVDQTRLFTGIVRDVTERKLYEQERDEADRRKDEFLATLAHELRNPLAPIRNAAQILQAKDSADPDLRWCSGIIDRQVRNMARLLDDLLDVSRITHHKLELRRETVTLSALIESAVETSRPLIDAGGHQLRVQLPPGPVYLDGDPVRLAQVFSNLLNNSARYCQPGGHIRLTGTALEDEVLVSVKDDGIGIDPQMLPRVFDIFAQDNVDGLPSRGGLGIGLSLVRGLVEIHGGSIEARSEGRGRGSEFIVRLQRVAEKPRANGLESAEGSGKEAAPARRLLIVDDVKDSADSLAMLMRMEGHEVWTAYDGSEALRMAERYKPEMVLLDLGMPGLNGLEVCRRLRDEPWGKDMFLVALTGWGQENDRRRTQEAGFDQHFVKPLSPHTLSGLLAVLPELAN